MTDDLPDVGRIAAAFRYCNWCKGYASDVRPVSAADQGSGAQQPSASACPRHRELHGLAPLDGPS